MPIAIVIARVRISKKKKNRIINFYTHVLCVKVTPSGTRGGRSPSYRPISQKNRHCTIVIPHDECTISKCIVESEILKTIAEILLIAPFRM